MSSDVLTYSAVGVTEPAAVEWRQARHRHQTSVIIGTGDACWATCREDVLTWGVKARSGFRVVGDALRVAPGKDFELIFTIGPVAVREPVRVVAVVDEPDRCGFAYGTRRGHPVSGEEAFIISRDARGTVTFALRSLTLPAPGWRTAAYPAFLTAQLLLRRRYLRALSC